jgi:hypothetical protein
MPEVIKILATIAREVGYEVARRLAFALLRGDADEAARAARIVAETVTAKQAIREARTRGGK